MVNRVNFNRKKIIIFVNWQTYTSGSYQFATFSFFTYVDVCQNWFRSYTQKPMAKL